MTRTKLAFALVLLAACSNDAQVQPQMDAGPDLDLSVDMAVEMSVDMPPDMSDELRVDFELTYTTNAQEIQVQVSPGGFPREDVDALRFDFGDGIAGWGETLTHAYREPGVWPVTLEVRLDGHQILRAKKLARINPGPDHNPLFLTINQIPSYINGSVPIPLDDGSTYEFAHQVPNNRFDVDIDVLDTEDNSLNVASIKLEAVHSSGTIDLTHLVNPTQLEGGMIHAEVREADALPLGEITLRVTAEDANGTTHQRELVVETVELTPDLDPFARPSDWLFRDDQDFFTTTRVPAAGNRYQFASEATPNGEADFLEEMRLMGALGSDESLNELFLTRIRQAIRKEVYRYFGIAPDGAAFDGIDMKIFWVGEPGAPDPQTFDEAGTFHMMRLGGVFEGFLGFSTYSAHNQERADDSLPTLGVASAGVLGALTNTPTITDAFLPVHLENGQPLGQNPHDALVLAPDFDPDAEHPEDVLQRYRALESVAQNIAYGLAPVIAHEMGHAMGLMPDGLPPVGFFGNSPEVAFVGNRTNVHHADLPGLNLMQAGGDTIALIGELESVIERENITLIELAKILSLETRLSPLSRAYLQRKLTYTNKD